MQRGRLGPARRRVPDLRRHVRLRPRAARRVVGLSRRLGIRDRQDRVVRGDGADLRLVRRPRIGLVAPARRPRRGRRADRARTCAASRARPRWRACSSRCRSRRCSSSSWRSRPAATPARRYPAGSSSLHGGLYGILQAAGLLFFAFAGYARIATLGEEVASRSGRSRGRFRSRSGSRSVSTCSSASPRSQEQARTGWRPARRRSRPRSRRPAPAWAVPVVRAGAAIASLGALLALIAGIGRTGLAMARNGDLPRWLAAVDPRHQVPHHAELAVAAVVAALVLTTDLRGAIGFSSFGVLTYYAIANASAFTQTRRAAALAALAERRSGFVACLVLVVTLPAVLGADRRRRARGRASRGAPCSVRRVAVCNLVARDVSRDEEERDGIADRRHGAGLRGRDDRRADQVPRLDRRLVGRALLASEGLHAGLHDRARLHGEDQAGVRPAGT